MYHAKGELTRPLDVRYISSDFKCPVVQKGAVMYLPIKQVDLITFFVRASDPLI